MSNINFAQMTLQGRLVADPKSIPLKSGTPMCKFRVAVNKRINKETEKTSFISVIVFDADATNCMEYLSTGRFVMVTGDFETDSYEDKEGIRRTGFSVRAQKVVFGSGGRANDATEDQKPTTYGATKGKRQAEEHLNKGRGRSSYGTSR